VKSQRLEGGRRSLYFSVRLDAVDRHSAQYLEHTQSDCQWRQ